MIELWLAAALAAKPPPVAVTADEDAALRRGEVVVRAPNAAGEMVGIVDVPVTTAKPVLDAVLDFDLRVKEVSAIEAITVYAPETDPKGLGATYELSVLGTKVVYHLRYEVDRAGGWCTFALDPERQHDIVSTYGSYRIDPVGAGQRLVYVSKTDTGRQVPGVVRNWIATSSVRSQLEAMRASAQTR